MTAQYLHDFIALSKAAFHNDVTTASIDPSNSMVFFSSFDENQVSEFKFLTLLKRAP